MSEIRAHLTNCLKDDDDDGDNDDKHFCSFYNQCLYRFLVYNIHFFFLYPPFQCPSQLLKEDEQEKTLWFYVPMGQILYTKCYHLSRLIRSKEIFFPPVELLKMRRNGILLYSTNANNNNHAQKKNNNNISWIELRLGLNH